MCSGLFFKSLPEQLAIRDGHSFAVGSMVFMDCYADFGGAVKAIQPPIPTARAGRAGFNNAVTEVVSAGVNTISEDLLIVGIKALHVEIKTVDGDIAFVFEADIQLGCSGRIDAQFGGMHGDYLFFGKLLGKQNCLGVGIGDAGFLQLFGSLEFLYTTGSAVAVYAVSGAGQVAESDEILLQFLYGIALAAYLKGFVILFRNSFGGSSGEFFRCGNGNGRITRLIMACEGGNVVFSICGEKGTNLLVWSRIYSCTVIRDVIY